MDQLDDLIGKATERRLGDNQAPDDIAILRDRLAEASKPLLRRRDELLAALERAPAVIEDEETCGQVADYIKRITACAKAAEGARVAAKEPYLEAERAVDGFYRAIIDPLDKLKRQIEPKITAYQRAKAEVERRRREEEARRQREEADRLRREADEAALAIATAKDLDRAIGVDEQARQAAADAEVARRSAIAKPAELSRSRGDLGAVASLRTYWEFKDLDRDDVDLESLRPHLALDALEKAVRSFVRGGGRLLRGVTIFENTSTQVR
jgi:hypothetical protein